MSIEIRYITLGLASTNAYLVGDTETKEAVFIDPVDDAPALFAMAQEASWTIKLILATHAHFDHILASKALKAMTGAPFYIHAEALPMLQKLAEQGLRFINQRYPDAAEPDRLLTSDKEIIEVGAIRLETLYTPGHAPGHLAFYMTAPEINFRASNANTERGWTFAVPASAQNVVFSGDALFAGSVGRTDLPSGSHARLMDGIVSQLLTLPDETQVLSGHGRPTTIGIERTTNPYVLDALDTEP